MRALNRQPYACAFLDKKKNGINANRRIAISVCHAVAAARMIRHVTPQRRKTRGWMALVVLLLVVSQMEAFAPFQCGRRRPSQTCTPPLLSVSSLDTQEEEQQQHYNARVDRFHSDMIRLLEIRTPNIPSLSTRMERRLRPTVLQDDVDGAERVLQMLQHMVDLGIATEESYNIAMGAILQRKRLRWKRSSSRVDDSSTPTHVICAADQLEELLQQQSCQDVPISITTYNKVLEAYAVCATPRGDRNYAKRANALLENMMQDDHYNVDSLIHTLHAWSWQQANLQDGACAQRAHELLQLIFKEHAVEDAVQMQCYDWVLEAWSKSSSPGSRQKADDIFSKMKQLNATMNTDCGIFNTETYSNVILAWTKCADEGSAERAHALLQEMIHHYRDGSFPPDSEPELIAFNGCITAWARIARPDKGERILWDLEQVSRDCQRLVPNAKTYNSVLHAHVMSRDKLKALDKAIAIVQHMEEKCKHEPAVTPDSFTYNTLMKAWVQSGQAHAPQEAEAILSKMEQLALRRKLVEITTRNYNVVINAYAKSKDRLAASKAHALLRRMEASNNNDNHVQPDIISYTSVIECYAKSCDFDASLEAEKLLQNAMKRYELTHDKTLMPNLRTYTMTIQALALCPRQGNVVKARELLTRLTELYDSTRDESLRPNEYPYNYVINCAANTIGTNQEKVQAFQIATRTYQEMRNSHLVQPDSFTHAFWIKACNNLLPLNSELHTKCVSIAFEQCKKDGLVTNQVLNRLVQGSSTSVVESLLETTTFHQERGQQLQVQDLPSSWSRNTVQQPRRPRGFER